MSQLLFKNTLSCAIDHVWNWWWAKTEISFKLWVVSVQADAVIMNLKLGDIKQTWSMRSFWNLSSVYPLPTFQGDIENTCLWKRICLRRFFTANWIVLCSLFFIMFVYHSGLVPGIQDDLPSPIPKDYNHGYQSDHSDHSSSADGRARSSRSSLKSSPGSSPFGSTQILTNGQWHASMDGLI